jgi:hypothetical protein
VCGFFVAHGASALGFRVTAYYNPMWASGQVDRLTPKRMKCLGAQIENLYIWVATRPGFF